MRQTKVLLPGGGFLGPCYTGHILLPFQYKKIYDKIVYECSLCKACEEKCPLNLKLCDAFRKARKVLVESGKETEENKEMIKNIKEFGNPFGKVSGKIGKLYCC